MCPSSCLPAFLSSLSPSAHELHILTVAVLSIHEWARSQPHFRKYQSQGGMGLYGGAGVFSTVFTPPSLPSAVLFDDGMDADEDVMVWDGLEMPPAHPGGMSAASANSGWGGVPMFPLSSSSSGHALRSGRTSKKRQKPVAAPKTTDLLEEFDTRMKQVCGWTFGDTEAIHLE